MSNLNKISLHLCAVGALAISTVFAAPAEKPATPVQIAAESKRANEFFDQKFDEYVARHPQVACQLGLKIGYDKWDDLSDAAAAQDLAISLENLAELKREFDFNKLDPQTQLSWRLFASVASTFSDAGAINLRSYRNARCQLSGGEWGWYSPSII